MELSLTKVACFPQRWSTTRKHALIRSAMRITFAYMVLVWSSIQVMTANPGISQELQQMTVTISAHQESLKTVLKRIEEKTGLSFVMPMNEVETYTDVSLPFRMQFTLKQYHCQTEPGVSIIRVMLIMIGLMNIMVAL